MAATAKMEKTTTFNEAEKSNSNEGGVVVVEVDDEVEEGEIVEEPYDNTTSSSLYLSKEIKAKHPLEHSWTFWFDTLSRHAVWGSTLRNVYTFSTVEDFWGAYNNIHHPSKLVMPADFHCFKHKIEPKWEDPVCANGGTWKMSVTRGKLDTSWLNTLLAMIGHQFDHGDEICGAVVSVRSKGDKIALWTKNAANEAAQIRAASGPLKQEVLLRRNFSIDGSSWWPQGSSMMRHLDILARLALVDNGSSFWITATVLASYVTTMQ